MAGPPFALKARDVLMIPPQFSGISSGLDGIFDRLGVVSFSYAVNNSVDPSPPTLPEVVLTLDELAAAYGNYEEATEEVHPPPPPSDPPKPAAAYDLGTRALTLQLKVLSDIVIDIPGLDGFSLVLNPGALQATVTTSLSTGEFTIAFTTALAFRFAPNLLRPMKSSGSGASLKFEPDASKPYVQITAASITVTIGSDGNIDLAGGAGLKLDQPVMIGETGVIVESADIVLSLSGSGPRPTGTPAGWRGLLINKASIRMPNVFSAPITATGFGIGSGGVSGTIGVGPFALSYDPTSKQFTGDLVGQVFGISGGLKELALTFQQNIPAGGTIRAQLALPFFDSDDPVDVDISIGPAGFLAAIHSADGLLNLKKANLFDLTVDAIAFELTKGVALIKLSGTITPKIPGLNWPGLRVDEFSIDSNGNVHLDGGWINLPNQYALDFHGFKIEITQLGFGKYNDGGKWIGVSGGVHLIGDMPAGASVEGLRISWYPDGKTNLTLNGVAVDFQVPGVLQFHGHVAFHQLTDGTKRFDGEIKLELTAIKLKVDAKVVFGRMAGGEKFFAIYVGVDLPSGIPVFSGLSLYGMAGLFALQMSPNKKSSEGWFENDDGTNGWYKRDTPGVNDLAKKWDPKARYKAFGAGITAGTSDNGFTFSAKALFVIVFPGPLLLIDGRANLLKDRAKLDDDPLFRSLTVLDIGAGNMLIALDARYKYGSGGELIDIRAGAEAFFDFKDATKWHIYLGVDAPRERRIRAAILSLFEANSYFMIDAHRVATGAWAGFDRHWQFGPLSMTLEAWIEGNARLSWKPAYFHGDLWLHGSAAVKIFGVGLGIGVDARFAADVFNPYHIVASLAVSLDLPWPLKDYEADITLEWGPQKIAPRVPLPLKDVAIEHFKVTTSWPLPRGSNGLLQPNYDGGDGFIGTPAGAAYATPPNIAPRVPVDCRPHITFGRVVHDVAGVGVNAQPVWPDASPAGWEWIGDPSRNEGAARVRYSLNEVVLEKYTGSGWREVSRAGGSNPGNVPRLWGSWAPVPGGSAGSVANNKLWLWSRTPFDYTRHTGTDYDDWFTKSHPAYPCIPAASERSACCDFSRRDPGSSIAAVTCGEEAVTFDRGGIVTALDEPILGVSRALCFRGLPPGSAGWFEVPGPSTTNTDDTVTVSIHLAEPATNVRIVVCGEEPSEEHVADFRGRAAAKIANPMREAGMVFQPFDTTQPIGCSIVLTASGVSGLACEERLDIALPCLANQVDLSLNIAAASKRFDEHDNVPNVTAFHVDGSVANTQLGVSESMTIAASGIARISIVRGGGPTLTLLRIRIDCSASLHASATAFDSKHAVVATSVSNGHVITLAGKDITDITLSSSAEICIAEICVTMGAATTEVTLRNQLAQRMKDSLVRWSAAGEVLEPYSSYRLKIVTGIEKAAFDGSGFNGSATQTEYAFFNTDGPPGLANFSPPPNTPADAPPSALTTLAPYVRQTVPPSVTAAGEKPLLPRPVYRAYDLKVDFNEDYVDLMYRSAGRDLGIYLFDTNDLPLRDASGALVIPRPNWSRAETVTLTEGERRWVETVNKSKCATALAITESAIPAASTLAQPSQKILLGADTTYEARLLPLLLHDDFAAYPSGTSAAGPSAAIRRWLVRDGTSATSPSKWTISGGNVTQSTAISTYFVRGADPERAANHPEQPANWSDYRFSAILRASDPRSFGIVFRWRDVTNLYAFVMDRGGSSRVLVRRTNSGVTVLASDHTPFELNRDYLVAAEAIGSRLRILVDGVTLFEAADATHATGSVGFWCGGNTGASFADVRVQDFRATTSPAYRFRFHTSKYGNFFHHMHSFNDETWPVTVAPSPVIDAALARAVAPETAISEDESRAYAALASAVFGSQAERSVPRVEIELVKGVTGQILIHVRTGEPIDWTRCSAELRFSVRASPSALLPRGAKFTDASFDGIAAESLTILARDTIDLSGCGIMYNSAVAAPLTLDPSSPDWKSYYSFGSNEIYQSGAQVKITPATQRFVAGTRADVLLLSPAGKVLHARRFVPDGTLGKVNARLLRRRDGTAFFISSAGTWPVSGTYRLRLAFRRGEGLSENGSTATEVANVDFPAGFG